MDAIDVSLALTLVVATSYFFAGRGPNLAKLVRSVRPTASLLIVVSLLLVRLVPRFRPSDSLLQLAVASLEASRTGLGAWLRAQPYVVAARLAGPLETLWLLGEDLLAYLLVVALCRAVYVAYHYSLSDWTDLVTKSLFDWARDNIPAVRAELDKHTHSFAATSDQVLGKDPNRKLILALPEIGRPAPDILAELEAAADREDEKWRQGRASGIVYNDDRQHTELMCAVYKAYSSSNPLHPGFWPRLNQCEAEVIAMTAALMHAPAPTGAVTSGGTESIILAIRAHWNHYGRRRGIRHPEIVCSSSAHAAVNKACDMFGIRMVVVDCDDGRTYQLHPGQVRRRITSNTIMIYASAPSYPHGAVDPIAALSDLARDFDVGLHVDACLGGFVLAFHPDAPPFDFRHAGVTSLSADTHKYGYAAKGTSVLLYRAPELRRAQYFCYPHWTGGMYATPTVAGSRPGALAACAWASLVALGRAGFRARAARVVEAARAIAAGIARTPGLRLMTTDPFVVVCFGSDEVDIYRVLDAMKTSGWTLDSMQNPPCVHVCVTLPMTTQVAAFLKDLRKAVLHVRREGTAGKTKGTAGIYGAVGSLPEGPVECVLQAFIDMTLAP